MSIKLFADAAGLTEMEQLSTLGEVSGFTTNPTLMLKAGVTDYLSFAKDALLIAGDRPISFEVFSDDFDEMYEQANILSQLGSSVFVKIPVTNTAGESAAGLVSRLVGSGVKVNITAMMTVEQVSEMAAVVGNGTAVFSVFAGRVADTGRDPVGLMAECVSALRDCENSELLWASPREILNLVQAEACGADIITMTPDLWAKKSLLGKDLEEYSLETVKMFFDDAQTAGFSL